MHVSGMLLLDKPSGMSSQRAVQCVQKLFRPFVAKVKAGHTGTLDPMATGLLPIALGEATKFTQYLLEADKGYEAVLKLGAATTSLDADGEVVETKAVPAFTQAEVLEHMRALTGSQLQTPPMVSALKVQGKKLYELARQGVEVERKARSVEIKRFELLHADSSSICFAARVSKGTYIRVLGQDLAHKLGTCGHLTQLKRTSTAGFDLDQAVTLDQLEGLDFKQLLGQLLPCDAALTHLPAVEVSEEEVERLKLGQRLHRPEWASDKERLVRVLSGSKFYGLASVAASGRMQPSKMCMY